MKLAKQKLVTSKGKKAEGPGTSSDNEGSFERPGKKPCAASSASVMHVQPLRTSDDDDDHSLLISTLTGGHGVFMSQAEAIDQLARAAEIDFDDFTRASDDDELFETPALAFALSL